jgi:hypothetical protein
MFAYTGLKPEQMDALVMWDQSCLLPSFSRLVRRRERISMMRLAMPSTSAVSVSVLSPSFARTPRRRSVSIPRSRSSSVPSTHVVALLDEVTGSEGVLVGITTGKALVGHVEEGEVSRV